jgi:hypothetical protein
MKRHQKMKLKNFSDAGSSIGLYADCDCGGLELNHPLLPYFSSPSSVRMRRYSTPQLPFKMYGSSGEL